MNKNTTARRWAIVGIAIAVASMVVLFIVGLVQESIQMMVTAGTVAVAVVLSGLTAITAAGNTDKK